MSLTVGYYSPHQNVQWKHIMHNYQIEFMNHES
jgi:hypothetical protein